jgi:hypothetical protein
MIEKISWLFAIADLCLEIYYINFIGIRLCSLSVFGLVALLPSLHPSNRDDSKNTLD